MSYLGHASYRAFIQAVESGLTSTYNTAVALINSGITSTQETQEGPRGPTGPAGISGPMGPTGPAGAAGVGMTGPTGPAGAMGPTGARGATGPQKATGATGARGAVGLIGPVGVSGPTGAAGAAGTLGATGTTGVSGPGGSVGVTGPSGPALTAIPLDAYKFPNDIRSGYGTLTDTRLTFDGTYWDHYNGYTYYAYKQINGNVTAATFSGAEADVFLETNYANSESLSAKNGSGFSAAYNLNYITVPERTLVRLQIHLSTITITGSPVTWRARIRGGSATGTVLATTAYQQNNNHGAVFIELIYVTTAATTLYGTLECSGAFTDSPNLFNTFFNSFFAKGLY